MASEINASIAILLGKITGALYFILHETNCDDFEKVKKLKELEKQVRADIEKLYYS